MNAPTRAERGHSNKHTEVDAGEPRRLQPYMKNHRQLRDDESERNGLLEGKAHQLLSNTKISPKAYTQIPLYRLSRLYLGICLYIYMYIYACNNNE